MPRIVSNSEITTYNSCELQHYYMYTLGLGPREPSMPIYRGTVGHKALEVYYKAMMDGYDIDTCTTYAMKVLEEELLHIAREESWNFKKTAEINMIASRIGAYGDVYRQEPFKVVAVEEVFFAPMFEDTHLGCIPDLVVEYTRGPYNGQLAIYDHKFVYNFKTVDELKLDAQLPKYQRVMQKLGYPVQHIVFNQVRTRDLKSTQARDLFRRSECLATDHSTEVLWQEQSASVRRIDEGRPPIRALAPMVCKGCWFKDPCTADMDGVSTEKILRAGYVKRMRPLKEMFND